MAGNARFTRVLVGGFVMSSQTSSVTVTTEAERQDTTPLEATGKEYVVMPPSSTIAINGYTTVSATDTGTWEKVARDTFTTADTVSRIFSESSTYTGQPADVLPSAMASTLALDFPVDGVMTVNAQFGSTVGLRHGICIYSGTVSATGTTTPIDLGAVGSAGGYAYLHVTAEGGTGTNADIDIESATTSGGTYASEGTFTFSGIGDYSLTLSGTVNRYMRLNVTDLGGATSWTVHAIVCVDGVTYYN